MRHYTSCWLILAPLGTTELRTLKDEFKYMTNILAVTTLGYKQNNLPAINAMVIIEINHVKLNRRPNLPNKEPENTVADNA